MLTNAGVFVADKLERGLYSREGWLASVLQAASFGLVKSYNLAPRPAIKDRATLALYISA